MDEYIPFQPDDLTPVIDLLDDLLSQTVQTKVYNEWLLGINIAMFFVLVGLIFAVFISQNR